MSVSLMMKKFICSRLEGNVSFNVEVCSAVLSFMCNVCGNLHTKNWPSRKSLASHLIIPCDSSTASIIALMIEAVHTSETSVKFYETISAISQRAVIFILTAIRT
jgi:hypothetical protein